MKDSQDETVLGYDVAIEPKSVDVNMAKKAGEYCAKFRKQFLKLSQKELAERNNLNQHNLSAFENGRSTNLNYLYVYYYASPTKLHQDVFKGNILDI